jgi:flagellin
MRINHNSLALNASQHFATINDNIAKSMSRLSSGYKITSPADDAAGLAISNKMDAQIRGLDRASLNSNDGVSVIQSAESGMNELHSILSRMRELAVQASNDVNSEDDRDAVQEEIDNLAEEIDQITSSTAFNGISLLDGGCTRRTLDSDPIVSTTYLSTSVAVGTYEVDIVGPAAKAEYSVGLKDSSATVTKEQAGTLSVNGFAVYIDEGMSMTEVYSALQEHLDKIGISVSAVDGNGDSADFATASSVLLTSKEYGSDQKIDISCENPELASLLGVSDGDHAEGKDCEVELVTGDDGFSKSATCTSDGYDITIKDRNGFEMQISIDADVDPDFMDVGGGTLDTKIEVLSAGTMVIQTGANSGEQLVIDIPSMDAKSLGVDNLIMYTHDYANDAVEAIDAAITRVSNVRSKMGAYQNRLENINDNLEAQNESLTEAYSNIMDTDMAEEMTEYTQQDVLAQAAISMMQKANERPESLLQLLQ